MTQNSICGVDFHCHLDLYPDFPGIITECEAAGVVTLAVTTTPRAYPRNEELTRSTRHIRAALGLHPQLVAERPEEITLFEELLPRTRYVGEVGLDAGSRFYSSFPAQIAVFTKILDLCARAGGKILSVHSVRSARHVLDLISRHLPPDRGRVVLHWFSGSAAELSRAVDLGCYFSVNVSMLSTPSGRSIVSRIPLNRLLTETDGPFVKIDGVATRPKDTVSLVSKLAESRGANLDETRMAILANLRGILAAS